MHKIKKRRFQDNIKLKSKIFEQLCRSLHGIKKTGYLFKTGQWAIEEGFFIGDP